MTKLVGRPLSWAITATSGAGFMLFGYDQGVMGGLLTGAAFTRTFPEIDTTRGGSSTLQGTVVAIYDVGCFFGAIITLFIGEWLGRRKTILLGCTTMIVGAILQASSSSIPQLIVGRIVAGLGNGLNTSTIPVWHSELMKATNRGKGICIELAVNISGIVVAYWLDYGMSYVNSDAQFRFPIALQMLFALLAMLGVSFLPESPRWLVAHGRIDDARHILWSLEHDARSLNEDDPKVDKELSEIKHAIEEERRAAAKTSYRTLFRNGPQKFRYRTLLGIGGQFIQQLSGINLITYYAPVIFEQSVGLPHNTSLLLGGCLSIVFFLSALIPIWIIDKLGRRKLMLFAAAGQAVCMCVLAGTVSDGGKQAGIAATVMLFLFDFFFGVGLLAIPWLLPPEYAPLAIRTRAAALATASNWIFTFLVVEITPVSIGNIGYKTYVYFAIFNAAFLPLIYFFYPETRNLSLEQIDKLFIGDKISMHWKPYMNEGESSMIMEDDKGNAMTQENKEVVQ